MSTLKYELHKNDFLMDKVTKQLFFVIKIDLHTVWVRVEEEDKPEDPDDVELRRVPKHTVNLSMIKVKKDVMKVLYGDKGGKITPDSIPDTNAKA